MGQNLTYKIMDRGYIEMVGPEGVSRAIKQVTKSISGTQSG